MQYLGPYCLTKIAEIFRESSAEGYRRRAINLEQAGAFVLSRAAWGTYDHGS